MSSHWKIRPQIPEIYLGSLADYPPPIAQLLYNRGITSSAEAEVFFAADHRLHVDPFSLPDMGKAISRIHQALLRGETIAVYGDFDADGVCSTALLVEGLELLGNTVIPYIPHRLDEERGLSITALEGLCQQGVTLVITVDCGTSSAFEVEWSRSKGMDVIITDHHDPICGIPEAVAVVNPKNVSVRKDSDYSASMLAGVGVAFKLLEALFHSLSNISTTRKEECLEGVLDLVALGTVADMVPLVGENRYLVKRGIEVLRAGKRLGIREMASLAMLNLDELEASGISWKLAPRLNAAGRIEHAITSYQLLTSHSPVEAHKMAQELEWLNSERQRLTRDTLARAKEQIPKDVDDAYLIMVGDKDYPPGVAGLVASRLVDEYYRPAVIFEKGETTSRGSARSIPEFNIVAALGECSDLLSRFGGHPMAAGFTLSTKNLGPLYEHLSQIARAQLSSKKELYPALIIDSILPFTELKGKLFQFIGKLAPFGVGNPSPVFLSRGVEVRNCRSTSRGEHLKLEMQSNNSEGVANKVIWRGIGFGLGGRLADVTDKLDIVYSLAANQWGSDTFLELRLLDFTPSP